MSENDVYRAVFAALDDSAIITVNESAKAISVGELRVECVREDPLEVDLKGYNGRYYTVDFGREEPTLFRVTEDGLSYEDPVKSVELIGMTEKCG